MVRRKGTEKVQKNYRNKEGNMQEDCKNENEKNFKYKEDVILNSLHPHSPCFVVHLIADIENQVQCCC